jgi:hypothetical protein
VPQDKTARFYFGFSAPLGFSNADKKKLPVGAVGENKRNPPV